ncbi:ABC transporter substrate-binding protein [Roseovarius sp. MMSF_3305]|nr:transporter substrate-binding domain-containing protein [Roseovarius sp. MMSF_3305]
MLRLAALFCVALISQPAFGDPNKQDRVVAANFPPIMIEGNQARPGYAIEILQVAAERASREIDVAFYPLRRGLAIMQSEGSIIFPSLLRTPERENQFLWLARIGTQFFEFVSRDTPIETLDQARKLHSIAVPQSGVADIFLTSRGFDNLFRVSSSETAFLMLTHGRVDAWLTSEPIARKYVAQNQTGVTLAVGQPVHELTAFIASSPDLSPDIAEAYRAAVETMRTDGTIARIAEKYGVELD